MYRGLPAVQTTLTPLSIDLVRFIGRILIAVRIYVLCVWRLKFAWYILTVPCDPGQQGCQPNIHDPERRWMQDGPWCHQAHILASLKVQELVLRPREHDVSSFGTSCSHVCPRCVSGRR